MSNILEFFVRIIRLLLIIPSIMTAAFIHHNWIRYLLPAAGMIICRSHSQEAWRIKLALRLLRELSGWQIDSNTTHRTIDISIRRCIARSRSTLTCSRVLGLMFAELIDIVIEHELLLWYFWICVSVGIPIIKTSLFLGSRNSELVLFGKNSSSFLKSAESFCLAGSGTPLMFWAFFECFRIVAEQIRLEIWSCFDLSDSFFLRSFFVTNHWINSGRGYVHVWRKPWFYRLSIWRKVGNLRRKILFRYKSVGIDNYKPLVFSFL